MAHHKPNLPVKDCAACGRPFAWRKKWARDWDAVRYCSEACRAGRQGGGRSGAIRAPSKKAPDPA